MNRLQKLKNENAIVFSEGDQFEKGYERLPSGIYKVVVRGGLFNSVPAFEAVEDKDKLVKFKTGIIKDVMNVSKRFFSSATVAGYNELKIFHKMGMLFYGPQGTGKTSVCRLIMQEMCNQYDAVCLDATGKRLGFIRQIIQELRKIQTEPIVLFVDEFDEAINKEEEAYLTFLDGNDSIDNMIIMGCTNYIEEIPDRIKHRPSRVKHLFEVKALPLEVYKEYVMDRLPSLPANVINEIAFKAEGKGLTIDQVKHVLIDVRIDGYSIDEAIVNVCKTVGRDGEYEGIN